MREKLRKGEMNADAAGINWYKKESGAVGVLLRNMIYLR